VRRTIETEVIVVGSGPAGSATALLLSTYGIANVMLTKYRWTANTPRAHITNQGTMEILRELGLEEDVVRVATPWDDMGDTVFCQSLAGEELGRLRTWGTHPRRRADYLLASPSEMCDIPQTLLEPILVSAAAARGTRLRLDTEYLSLTQDDDGVTATVLDRLSGETYDIRAPYLVGADGGNSKVAEDVGLPLEGQMDIAGSMNIVFRADLTRFVAHRPSVLYWILDPELIGGIGMGVIRMVRRWDEWLVIWGYDISRPPPVVDDAEATRIAHKLIGDDTVPITIESTSLWGVNKMYATRYSAGRVFCMGDACHRHPPSNGLGSNTSIQDAHNLAWKLALVLRGTASPALLESYDAERVPLGRQIVERANQSIGEFGPIFGSLGLGEGGSIAHLQANMDARKLATPAAAAQRAALRSAIAFKDYEFNAHGVELNQRYRSTAIVGDGTPEPPFEGDPELTYSPTTWPGARLPHCWVERHGARLSTKDLVGRGRFTLLTGIGGDGWGEAAATAATALGADIHAVAIGPGCEVADTYGDWARTSAVDDGGCLLVRPDGYVGWRCASLPDDPAGALDTVMRAILGR
jgi:2,4-dichlorophenol 6-monooxygenase